MLFLILLGAGIFGLMFLVAAVALVGPGGRETLNVRAVVAVSAIVVYVVKTSGTKGEPLKRATWTLTGSGSSQICQPPFG